MVHKVVLDGISENIASLVQLGKYVATNAAYPTKMVYYVIKCISESCTPQEYQAAYVQVSNTGELVVEA